MKRIYLATQNKGKVHTVKNVLSKYKIEVIHYSLNLPEPRSDDLRKIAKEKVLFAYKKIRKPCIAIDSGFYIYSLNGFPKTFVNFVLKTIGIEGILRLVKGKSRGCEFRNCLAYFDESLTKPVFFESRVKGNLATSLQGRLQDHCWSELFLVFIPEGMRKTLAKMTFEEYQKWQAELHKHSFINKFAKWILKK